MVDQDKLIKKGIKYTDTLFDGISKRVESGVRTSDTLEAFLNKTKGYTENNPLVTSGYDKEMLKIILEETNNHKFSRPSQKELVRVTIENQVGELIKDVGDDLKDTVRQIVKTGYNENWSQDKIAEEISDNILTLRNKRARTIARTEIARTATISDYIINKEMGATHFYVECRNTACPICKEAWHKHWKPENDDSFTPKETTAGGKGWVGDNKFSMTDTKMLPPIHPNCRCVPYFISDEDGKPVKPQPEDVPDPTPEQLKKNLTPAERDKYENYKRNIPRQMKWLQDNPNAAPEEIAKHQKRLNFMQKKLNELKRKALGGSVGKPVQPKKQPKPQPQAKPKTNKKQAEPKQPQLQPDDTGLPGNRNPHRSEFHKLSWKERRRWYDLQAEMKYNRSIYDDPNQTPEARKTAWQKMKSLSAEWKALNRKAMANRQIEKKMMRRKKEKELEESKANKNKTSKELEVDEDGFGHKIKRDLSIKYEDIKTDQEIAAHFGLEFEEIDGQKIFKDHLIYIDPDTGQRLEKTITVDFDRYFTKNTGAKKYIDNTNSGKHEYDLKECVKIFCEAPEQLKWAVRGGVHFVNDTRSRALAYCRSDKEVRILPKIFAETRKDQRGNLRQSMYHEMCHCLDMSYIEDKDVAKVLMNTSRYGYVDINQAYNYMNTRDWGISAMPEWEKTVKDEQKWQADNGYEQEYCSWYGDPKSFKRSQKYFAPSENWAETGSMAAMDHIKDRTNACMQRADVEDGYLIGRMEYVPWDEWIKRHKITYDYAVNRIKKAKPTEYTYL